MPKLISLASIVVLTGLSAFAKESKKPAPTEDATRKVFTADELKSVALSTEHGDIELKGTERFTVSVELTKTEGLGNCEILMKPEKGELRVEVKDKKGWSKPDCLAGLRVEVPKRLDASVSSGTGDIDASGLDGDLDAQGGTGELRLKDLHGLVRAKSGTGAVTGSITAELKAEIKTGTGAVKLKGLRGTVSVETGTGEVELEYASTIGLKDKHSAAIKTGTGGASVAFPEGSQIKTSYKSGMGKLANELGENPAAAFLLSMESGMGRLTVNKIKTAAQ